MRTGLEGHNLGGKERALMNHCNCSRGSVFEINMKVNGSLPVTQFSPLNQGIVLFCKILKLLLETSTRYGSDYERETVF